MTSENQTKQIKRKWLYPAVYLLLIIFTFLPPYAEIPYEPQNTQDVILNLLMVSIAPYKHFGWVFHLATLLIVALIAVFGERIGGFLAAYMGIDYLVIAFTQAMGTTEKYGFVIHTGALITSLVLGITWLVVAVRGTLKPSFKSIPPLRYLLLPLALLAFWSPLNNEVQPYFNPVLLITSPDYGLTFCFTTPVFLFLLVLFYPKVDAFAYRITAFNGLLYGLFNLIHFFNPQLRWLGVMHLPLLIISLCALMLPWITKRSKGRARHRKKEPQGEEAP